MECVEFAVQVYGEEVMAPENDGQEKLLSVVFPAYNEAERGLEERLLLALRYLDRHYTDYEAIVVDDGSIDVTPEVVHGLSAVEPALRLVRLENNQGKGAAVRAGFLSSRGKFVVFMDADLATPLEELERLLEEIRKGADVAIASRGMPDSILERRENPVRELCGKLYNRLVQRLVVPGIMDTQCGFKCFQGTAARSIAPALSEPRFGFDVELLYLARAAGFSIREIPVHWAHQPGSRLHFVRDGFSMMAALLRIWWRKHSGQYAGPVASIRERYQANHQFDPTASFLGSSSEEAGREEKAP